MDRGHSIMPIPVSADIAEAETHAVARERAETDTIASASDKTASRDKHSAVHMRNAHVLARAASERLGIAHRRDNRSAETPAAQRERVQASNLATPVVRSGPILMPAVDLVAVNQCSGNSRGFFQPRVSGGQWSNGAMGNARWTGVRLKDVLDRARIMVRSCGPAVPPHNNPGVLLGTAMGAAALKGRDKVTVIASPGVASFGAWAEQLIAESTGKVGKGLMAPSLARAKSDKVSVSIGHPQQNQLREALRALRNKVTAEADYVGDRFADEARKIHFGEVDPRGIYGEATREEVASLVEEGVDFMPLPSIPEEHN